MKLREDTHPTIGFLQRLALKVREKTVESTFEEGCYLFLENSAAAVELSRGLSTESMYVLKCQYTRHLFFLQGPDWAIFYTIS